jgi:hypothetical protein
MDEVVRAALEKWPNVPDVYGWLELDSRGRFRLRAGAVEPPVFETIGNAALASFIARNYLCDAGGRWYFQNGPQRVFVRLAATPWVFRLRGDEAPITQTGITAGRVDALIIDDRAAAILATNLGPGLIDDRDLDELTERLVTDAGRPLSDTEFEAWLGTPTDTTLRMRWQGGRLPVLAVPRARLGERFGYDPDPRPSATPTLSTLMRYDFRP